MLVIWPLGRTDKAIIVAIIEGELLQVIPRVVIDITGSQTLGSLNCSSQWQGSLPEKRPIALNPKVRFKLLAPVMTTSREGWESGSQRLLSGNVTLQIIWPNFLRTIWHN
jgi:hypothetical protein